MRARTETRGNSCIYRHIAQQGGEWCAANYRDDLLITCVCTRIQKGLEEGKAFIHYIYLVISIRKKACIYIYKNSKSRKQNKTKLLSKYSQKKEEETKKVVSSFVIIIIIINIILNHPWDNEI